MIQWYIAYNVSINKQFITLKFLKGLTPPPRIIKLIIFGAFSLRRLSKDLNYS
jgi:hypothetical protein